MRFLIHIAVALSLILSISCTDNKLVESWQPRRIEATGLPNAVQVHPQVLSGGTPAGISGFKDLKRLGVRTIVSVDAVKPPVELAARFDLNYVHLPLGYGSITAKRQRQLAKIVRDSPAPIYVHCHHGKHRAPAAAAVGSIGARLLSSQDGLKVLQIAGTGREYHGLYTAVQTGKPIANEILDQAEEPEQDVSRVARAMSALQNQLDLAGELMANGPASSSKLAHAALLLKQGYRELQRLDEIQRRSTGFRSLLAAGEQAAADLQNHAHESVSPERARVALQSLRQNCRTCHKRYRGTESFAANPQPHSLSNSGRVRP